MSKRRKMRGSDPRRLGGDIVGPGGSWDRGAVLVDTRQAVVLEDVTVSTVDNATGQPVGIALALKGHVNRTQDQVQTLFLFGDDGAAAILTELIALLYRKGDIVKPLIASIEERIATLRADGNLGPEPEVPEGDSG